MVLCHVHLESLERRLFLPRCTQGVTVAWHRMTRSYPQNLATDASPGSFLHPSPRRLTLDGTHSIRSDCCNDAKTPKLDFTSEPGEKKRDNNAWTFGRKVGQSEDGRQREVRDGCCTFILLCFSSVLILRIADLEL